MVPALANETAPVVAEVPVPETAVLAELVTLEYKQAALATVLGSLARTYDLNLVLPKELTGDVTMALREVTLDEALQAILGVNGYTFTRKGRLLYITPGPGLEGIDISTAAVALRFLTASEAKRLLGDALSSKGNIEVNEATNSLVVTDYPSRIAQVHTLLQAIDLPPIQVLIEAKLLDLQAEALENFGITHTTTYNPAGEEQGLFQRQTGANESIAATGSFNGPSSTLTGDQFTITTTLKDLALAPTIDLLVRNNKAHLLASPSVATLNGKEARIIIGEKFPYREQTQTTTGTTESTKFVDVGTTLRVTPLVSPDGWITMNVHPEVSSVSATLDAGPRITTREADATVRVRDGQTVIIGGLISKQEDRTRQGVPFLRDIPLVGLLFSSRSQELEEKELTVFITPRILAHDQAAALAQRQDVTREEVRLSVEAAGEVNLVEKLFQHARELQRGGYPITAHKRPTGRDQELLKVYKQIYSQFPHTPHADEALYRMGQLYAERLHQEDEAAKTFRQLIEQYPSSRYRQRAYRAFLKAQRRGAKHQQQLERLSQRQPLPEITPPSVLARPEE
jgi:type IV pilus secretin PilQ/predicted competence protein